MSPAPVSHAPSWSNHIIVYMDMVDMDMVDMDLVDMDMVDMDMDMDVDMEMVDMDFVDMDKQGLGPKGSSVDSILSFLNCISRKLQLLKNIHTTGPG